MTKILLTPSDLDANDFKVATDEDGGKIIRVNRDAPVVSYDASDPGRGVISYFTTEERRRLYLNNNFGYVHLDFVARIPNLNSTSFTLSSEAPTPKMLIETQTFDGGTIWMDPNTRYIRWRDLRVGQRYIVDLIGFWNI